MNISSNNPNSNSFVVMSTQNAQQVMSCFQDLCSYQPIWLEEGISFEINIPVANDAIYSLLNKTISKYTQLDSAFISNKNRRKKLLISDMDSTLIHQECIDEIAGELGLKSQVAKITEAAMRGELDFEAALNSRVALLKGLDVAALERVWQTKITLMEGAACFVKTMAYYDSVTILVSGGFTFFAQRVANALGLQHSFANQLDIQNNKLTGDVIPPILGQDAKLEVLKQFILKQNLIAEDCLAIGDGANDLKMIKYAGMGIAYQAKPQVQTEAAFRLNHTDLRGALYLQGYKASEMKGLVKLT